MKFCMSDYIVFCLSLYSCQKNERILCEASAIANRKRKVDTTGTQAKKYTTITTSRRNENNKKVSMCECTNENNKQNDHCLVLFPKKT